ncbi:unnamed protein product, partial [Amoebophrya sp. A25]
ELKHNDRLRATVGCYFDAVEELAARVLPADWDPHEKSTSLYAARERKKPLAWEALEPLDKKTGKAFTDVFDRIVGLGTVTHMITHSLTDICYLLFYNYHYNLATHPVARKIFATYRKDAMKCGYSRHETFAENWRDPVWETFHTNEMKDMQDWCSRLFQLMYFWKPLLEKETMGDDGATQHWLWYFEGFVLVGHDKKAPPSTPIIGCNTTTGHGSSVPQTGQKGQKGRSGTADNLEDVRLSSSSSGEPLGVGEVSDESTCAFGTSSDIPAGAATYHAIFSAKHRSEVDHLVRADAEMVERNRQKRKLLGLPDVESVTKDPRVAAMLDKDPLLFP